MTGLGANVVMNNIYVEEFYVNSNAQVVNHAKTTKTSFIGVHWVPLPSCKYCTMVHMYTILNLNIAINGTVMMLMILITMDNTIQH